MESKYNNRVITWAKIATIIFIALVVVADATSLINAQYISYYLVGTSASYAIPVLMASMLAGTICGYIVLFSVLFLLENIKKDIVFDKKNTKLMSRIVYGLVAAAACAVVGGFIWIDAFLIAVCALFVAVIVLAVKLCFDKAIEMKDELDLTI